MGVVGRKSGRDIRKGGRGNEESERRGKGEGREGVGVARGVATVMGEIASPQSDATA